MRRYLFVAIDRNTRLVAIGIYPKSDIEEAAALLRHCVSTFRISLIPRADRHRTQLHRPVSSWPPETLENTCSTKPARSILSKTGSHLLFIPKQPQRRSASIPGSTNYSHPSLSKTANPDRNHAVGRSIITIEGNPSRPLGVSHPQATRTSQRTKGQN